MSDDRDSVELEGPFKTRITATGDKTIMVLIAVLAIAAFTFMGWFHHAQMLKDNEEIKEQFSEVVYVLSLSPAEREKLNLAMPRGLRGKIKRHREAVDD